MKIIRKEEKQQKCNLEKVLVIADKYHLELTDTFTLLISEECVDNIKSARNELNDDYYVSPIFWIPDKNKYAFKVFEYEAKKSEDTVVESRTKDEFSVSDWLTEEEAETERKIFNICEKYGITYKSDGLYADIGTLENFRKALKEINEIEDSNLSQSIELVRNSGYVYYYVFDNTSKAWFNKISKGDDFLMFDKNFKKKSGDFFKTLGIRKLFSAEDKEDMLDILCDKFEVEFLKDRRTIIGYFEDELLELSRFVRLITNIITFEYYDKEKDSMMTCFSYDDNWNTEETDLNLFI